MASWTREEYLAGLLESSPAGIIAAIAFDLRTPMADIVGLAKLLKEKNATLEEKDREQYLNLLEIRSQTVANAIFAVADYYHIQLEKSQTTAQQKPLV